MQGSGYYFFIIEIGVRAAMILMFYFKYARFQSYYESHLERKELTATSVKGKIVID